MSADYQRMEKMKSKYSFFACIAGLGLIFIPLYVFDEVGWAWYFFAMIGLVLVGISGIGAQMEMMGQGDTGEEFLREMVAWVKAKFKRKKMDEQ
ncbi:hypothetical protein QTH91_19210 [Variovorax dokdonensis]|uniref:Uncharacterized protein n=1 Tax=Variovorax dokdonensis TaxID=344883 RepID=A0ABT7NFD0_9BURK|nr:hypothetical protein [Variovorax dokdonensis]MDM0046627.1 hypothetical protein [Variovorax dokdonensis]